MTINANSEMIRGGTMCLSKAGLGIGSTPAELSIAAPNGAGVDYAINGVMYHLADDATVAVTAAAAQAALTTCIYLVCLDSSGTLSTVKGTAVTTADITSGKTPLTFPQPTANTCPIGYVKVVTASGYTFTAATTDFDATGITSTYTDILAVPAAPIVS